MMITRRSVFTFGMLLAGVALLAPPATAQQATSMVGAAQVPSKFTQLKLTWEYAEALTAVEGADDLGFYVYYIKGSVKDPVAGATAAEKTAVMAKLNSLAELAAATDVDVGLPATRTGNGSTTFEYTLDGLVSNTLYAVTVLAYKGDLKQVANPAVIPGAAAEETDQAPAPRRVRNVALEAAAKMLEVTWDAPTSAGLSTLSIEGYQVRWRLSQTADEEQGDWEAYPLAADFAKTPDMLDMTSYDITGLVNGVSYDVQVRAVNDAKERSLWGPDEPGIRGTPSADGPTPTPALPLFGILGLGAGLVAAGRRRLRRRQQQLLS